MNEDPSFLFFVLRLLRGCGFYGLQSYFAFPMGSNRLIEMFGERACVFMSVVHMVCALHIDIHANN